MFLLGETERFSLWENYVVLIIFNRKKYHMMILYKYYNIFYCPLVFFFALVLYRQLGWVGHTDLATLVIHYQYVWSVQSNTITHSLSEANSHSEQHQHHKCLMSTCAPVDQTRQGAFALCFLSSSICCTSS